MVGTVAGVSELSAALIMIAAILTSATIISVFALKVYKVAKRIDGVLGVDKKGRTISDRLASVEYQLCPNGGSSMADKIASIELQQTEVRSQMESYRDVIAGLLKGSKSNGSVV